MELKTSVYRCGAQRFLSARLHPDTQEWWPPFDGHVEGWHRTITKIIDGLPGKLADREFCLIKACGTTLRVRDLLAPAGAVILMGEQDEAASVHQQVLAACRRVAEEVVDTTGSSHHA